MGQPAEKVDRIALGLAISALHCRRGVPKSAAEIARFCGCTRQAIERTERIAMEKLRHRLKGLRTIP